MTINDAAVAIEAFATTFTHAGAKPVTVTARASGDDVNAIKVRVDLGAAKIDTAAWSKALEAAVAKAVPSPYSLSIRVETD